MSVDNGMNFKDYIDYICKKIAKKLTPLEE